MTTIRATIIPKRIPSINVKLERDKVNFGGPVNLLKVVLLWNRSDHGGFGMNAAVPKGLGSTAKYGFFFVKNGARKAIVPFAERIEITRAVIFISQN